MPATRQLSMIAWAFCGRSRRQSASKQSPVRIRVAWSCRAPHSLVSFLDPSFMTAQTLAVGEHAPATDRPSWRAFSAANVAPAPKITRTAATVVEATTDRIISPLQIATCLKIVKQLVCQGGRSSLPASASVRAATHLTWMACINVDHPNEKHPPDHGCLG